MSRTVATIISRIFDPFVTLAIVFIVLFYNTKIFIPAFFLMIALPAESVFFPAEILSEQTITAAFKSFLNYLQNRHLLSSPFYFEFSDWS